MAKTEVTVATSVGPPLLEVLLQVLLDEALLVLVGEGHHVPDHVLLAIDQGEQDSVDGQELGGAELKAQDFSDYVLEELEDSTSVAFQICRGKFFKT